MYRLMFLSLISIFMLIGCTSEEATIEDTSYSLSELGSKVVAKVGNATITRAELDHSLAFYSSNPMTNSEEGRIELLNDMIEDQVMYNKAVENGFDQSPEYRNNKRKLLAYEYKKYLKQKVAELTKITDVDLELYYEQNIEKYTKPAMFRLAIFLIRDDLPNKPKYSLQQVKDAAGYLDSHEGFGDYALESHHSHTANRGGKLPWLNSDSQLAGIPSELIEKAETLDTGEVSDPIEIDEKTYLVRLMDRKEQSVTPLASIKPSLRRELLASRKKQLLNSFLDKEMQASSIEVYEQNIGADNSADTSSDSFGPPGFPVTQ